LANLQATLFLRIRTADGKRRIASPVYTANHKLKRLFATVDKQPEYHPEGIYYLRYYDGPKQVWERVGKDSDAAIAAQFRREQSLRAKAAGLQINGQLSRQSTGPGFFPGFARTAKKHISMRSSAAT
jgi:hypothetical protein